MAKTPEDILKKLKPSKTFDLTPEEMRAFADYVIEMGPAAIVTLWLELSNPKATKKQAKPKEVDPRVAALTARLTRFAKTTRLKSAEAAVAFLNYSREENASIPEVSASAQKGPAAAIKWLIPKAGLDHVEQLLSSFEDRFAS